MSYHYASKRVDIVADCANAKATVYRKRRYSLGGIDIVLLEGIFLFKPAYRDHFNLKIWIDCSFATALQRAIVRAQEGLSPAETKRAFEAIYFPAQQLHLERDQPNEHTDVIFDKMTCTPTAVTAGDSFRSVNGFDMTYSNSLLGHRTRASGRVETRGDHVDCVELAESERLLAGSPAELTNGSTAIDFSGMATVFFVAR